MRMPSFFSIRRSGSQPKGWRCLAQGLALASAAALACLFPPAHADTADKEPLLVYNAQHASLTQAWAKAFTAETGIEVVLRNGSDTELGNQLVQEGAASPADVFLTENSPAMALVDAHQLFRPLDADTTSLVPANMRPAHGRWIGIAARSTVLVYNPERLKAGELPKSLLDLADPRWKGRWAASPSGADFQAIVSALLALRGESATLEWLKGMKRNALQYKGNSVAMKAVNAGQVDAALIYHYYRAADQAKTGENSNHTAVYYFRNQDPGAFLSISGAGVLASSKHAAAAQAFVRWLVGKGGQGILRSGESYEYAVGAGMASNPKLVPLAELQYPMVEPSRLNSQRVTDLMIQAGLL